jgi:hypothetical protein
MRAFFFQNMFDCEIAKEHIEEYRMVSNAFRCNCSPVNFASFSTISRQEEIV